MSPPMSIWPVDLRFFAIIDRVDQMFGLLSDQLVNGGSSMSVWTPWLIHRPALLDLR